MIATKQGPDEKAEKGSQQHFSMAKAIILTLVLGTTLVIGYAIFKNQSLITKFLAPHLPTSQPGVVLTDSQSKPFQGDVRLTREGIDLLLDALDAAVRRKDVDGVLRHIAHGADGERREEKNQRCSDQGADKDIDLAQVHRGDRR